MNITSRNGYVDEWRGLSILMVVFHHLLLYRFPHALTVEKGGTIASKLAAEAAWFIELWAVHGGMVGVCVFFVISGYLITAIIVREEEQTGTLSLSAFYVRRIFRILPALVVYVLAVVVLSAAGLIVVAPGAVTGALSFVCNTELVDCSGPFNQFWSLAVEEQFYLVWPIALVLCRKRARIVMVWASLICSTIAAPLPEFRVHGWLSNGLAVACLSSGALYALSSSYRSATSILTRVPAPLDRGVPVSFRSLFTDDVGRVAIRHLAAFAVSRGRRGIGPFRHHLVDRSGRPSVEECRPGVVQPVPVARLGDTASRNVPDLGRRCTVVARDTDRLAVLSICRTAADSRGTTVRRAGPDD